VDFDLSEDQRALRDAATDLLADRAGPGSARAVMAQGSGIDRELWAAMADQGWTGISRPEATGGLGLGLVETAVLCEAIGAHVAPVPFLGTVLALDALDEAVASGAVSAEAPIGTTTVVAAADSLAEARSVGAVAWSRRPDSVTATRSSSGDETSAWLLTGQADPVVDGPVADVVVVVAAAPDGPALFALAPGPGEVTSEPAMDGTRSIGWLDPARRAALRIGGAEAVERLLDRGATLTGTEMLGAGARVLEMSVDYAKDRVQFDRPIGSFQAVKHRCADMLVDVEGMRSVTYYAAWAVGAEDAEGPAAASAAKVWCSDASARIMAGALQVHGGIGFTWEHDLHLYVKRAQLDRVRFGDATLHRERLARILRPRAEHGEPVL
jgi:alkylation response protein AidB-like acyl-CoA dehydrogenase